MSSFNCNFERCALGLFSESDLVMIAKEQIFPSSDFDGCPRVCVYIHMFIYMFIYIYIYIFNRGCTGSLLLHPGFLQLW